MRRQQTQVTLLNSALTGGREKGGSQKGHWGSREGLVVICLWDKRIRHAFVLIEFRHQRRAWPWMSSQSTGGGQSTWGQELVGL